MATPNPLEKAWLNMVEEPPMPRKNSNAGKRKVRAVMKEFAAGELHSGSKKGPKVKDHKQAVAIALAEAGLARKGKRSGK